MLFSSHPGSYLARTSTIPNFDDFRDEIWGFWAGETWVRFGLELMVL